jgi:hypothetical protein
MEPLKNPHCTWNVTCLKLESHLAREVRKLDAQRIAVQKLQARLERARTEASWEAALKVRPAASAQSQVRGLTQETATRTVVRQDNDAFDGSPSKRTYIDQDGRIQRT